MGRRYSGDIEGKFWFGVQSSQDASFFGGEEIEPNYFEYYFSDSDKDSIDAGIQECLAALGEYNEQLDAFFKVNDFYNDDKLAEQLDVSVKQLNHLLEWYARLGLGRKIQHCVEQKGECCFEAEF
jgi:hypothetical protein